MSASGSTTGGVVGLVLARPVRLLGAEPFFMEFIGGIEERLAERGMSLLLHVVTDHEAEIDTYRRWTQRQLVDAVAVVNLTVGDRRPAVLAELGLPAVLVGAWDDEPTLPAVPTDNDTPVREALAQLISLGHRRVARVSGPMTLLHTRARTTALVEACRQVGLESPIVLEGDYSHEAGTDRTVELLRRAEPPTAILYDNDVMAVAGLAAATGRGVAVPQQLSLVAWDDSTLCRLSSPPLTTMSVDVYQYGVSVAASLLEHIDGVPVTDRTSPAARFVPRGSTATAPSPHSSASE
ncbi:LacI family DNA-binding transcriptional regulator [Salinactinospora qingdaonensis]|uniref:Substrate-binding domain-containing protein n=1 Tax=Salinactinospora qingdaonensis TaxID=702744 RepID=A0ABP7GE81_9ACTN